MIKIDELDLVLLRHRAGEVSDRRLRRLFRKLAKSIVDTFGTGMFERPAELVDRAADLCLRRVDHFWRQYDAKGQSAFNHFTTLILKYFRWCWKTLAHLE